MEESGPQAAGHAMTSYPTIVPYLAVADAAAAIDFYKRAFGAEERMRVPGPDRAVMHAEILVNGGLVMLTDSAPQVGFPAPAPGEKVPVGIMVAWADAGGRGRDPHPRRRGGRGFRDRTAR
jgi:uncharacterized glyoxalase superfamily protein PhnB